jgi:hypothetical protein
MRLGLYASEYVIIIIALYAGWLLLFNFLLGTLAISTLLREY